MENNFINMLDDMPEGLSDIEKLRWIYIKVCKRFSYDLEYWSKLDKSKSIFYKSIDDIKDNKVVCSTISEIFTRLSKKAGLDVKTLVVDEYGYDYGFQHGHALNEVNINGQKVYCSLIYDLEKVKFGAKTRGFMIDDIEEEMGETAISDEDLQAIDDKIGYTVNGFYIEDVVGMMQDEFNELKDNESLRESLGIHTNNPKELEMAKLDFIAKFVNDRNLDEFEKNSYFKYLVRNSLKYSLPKFFDYYSVAAFDKKRDMFWINVFFDRKDNYDENLFYIIGKDGIEKKHDVYDSIVNDWDFKSENNRDSMIVRLNLQRNSGKFFKEIEDNQGTYNDIINSSSDYSDR
ncbi:MAG: hypothetical protein HXK69_00840 [Clostridiales bacterium]|nr:hypothetical protein [Clostridiales bacterium]